MNRRGFLAGMLALGVAPAIVRAESLMRIVVPSIEDVVRYGHYGAIKISGADFQVLQYQMSECVQVYEESPLITVLLREARE